MGFRVVGFSGVGFSGVGFSVVQGQEPLGPGLLLESKLELLMPWDSVLLLVVQCPSNMLVYLRDGSAQTILHAATLR